jgi:hypothetical protein
MTTYILMTGGELTLETPVISSRAIVRQWTEYEIIYLLFLLYLYIYKRMCVCGYVCVLLGSGS